MARERDDYSRLLMELDADIESLRRVNARPIEPARVMVVQGKVDPAVSGFESAHERFRSALKEIRERLPGDAPAP